MPNRTNLATDADRFWSKVDRSGECWFWTGAKTPLGYGRVVIGQEEWKAHRLAWFLVMGRLPKHGLYHVAKDGAVFSRMNPGAGGYRGCVRPHHFRDGPNESAPSRWAKRAMTGFPPEFRSITDQLMSTEQAERDLMPLLLYHGNLTFGRAQALFNFTMAAQAAEAERLGDIVAMSRFWPDVSHAVGLHKPVTATRTIANFWGRILDNPQKVGSLRPGMKEYIRDTLAASGERPFKLAPIDRYSPWTKQAWRKPPRAAREPKAPTAPTAPLPPLTEVWPFIPEATNPDHDLVMAVDRAVGKRLPEIIRQDVCQDLILAVLEGQVTTDELADSSEEYIKAVFRMYPTKYGAMSLDAPMGETDRNLYETLADAPLILDGGFSSLADLRDRLREQEAVA